MAPSKNQNYLYGAAILTAAVIIVKIFGAFYKITLGVILDEEGFGLFNVAYNLYAVVLALSTAGLPIAVSRMISEANNLNRPEQVKKIFSTAIIAFVVLGVAGSAAMLIFPVELAAFMEDVRASRSIMALAPSILLCCIMSAFRGYSQGLSDMRPTAISQILEVGIKLLFGIALVLIFRNRGAGTPVMSAAAISGVSVGSLVACVYIGIVATRRMRSERLRIHDEGVDKTADRRSEILKSLVKIGVPIAFGSCVLAIITLVSAKLILNRLQFEGGLGLTQEAATGLYGVYSMALTLYNLPISIITPLTVSVIPAISGYLVTKKYGEAKSVIESSLRISAIIALPMAVGLSVLADPVMNGLYDTDAQQGGGLLMIMGVSSFFMCFSLMTSAVLQASGRERLPAISMVVGGIITVAGNWYLVGNPDVNIFGAPIAILACNVVMCALNIVFMMKRLPERPSLKRIFVLPVINALIMGAAAWLVYPAVLQIAGAGPEPSRLVTLIAMVAAVAVGAGVYLVLTIMTKSITMEDMMLIPKGEKLAKLLRIKSGGKHMK